MTIIRKLIPNILFFFLIVFGFWYRIYGLADNHSFWSDEENVAIFSRAILERGSPVLANGYSTGVYQWLQYWFSAISAKVFGLNEFTIRFPSIVFGVLTISAVYLLGKELFNKNVGLISAFLITFLKIEILWSRQARPYQALQFFYLLVAWFIYKLVVKERLEWRYFVGFIICGILASLMHGLGVVIVFTSLISLLISRPKWLKIKAIIAGFFFLGILIFVFKNAIFRTISTFSKVNNFFYYRVFLWHNYPLLVFLAFAGASFLIFQRKISWKFTLLYLVIQMFVVSYILAQPFVRYFYVVLPFLILLSSYGLEKISLIYSARFKPIILLIFFLLIMGTGDKFILVPKRAYSLNEDMQEIPEVDWKKVYGLVKEKLTANQEAVLLTNWNDLPVWFLGENKLDFLLKKPGKKKILRDSFSSATIIYSLEEFKNIVVNSKKGIVVIDSWDDVIPEGISEHCQKVLKKELEVDRLYSTQPRYWTVWVYSWGI